jgi:hypothetical protein
MRGRLVERVGDLPAAMREMTLTLACRLVLPSDELEPEDSLLHADGRSTYRRHGGVRYATSATSHGRAPRREG